MTYKYINIAVVSVLLVVYSSVAAAWIHVAREDETLEMLAVRYYGSAEMTMVIRAANGFVHPDDGRLTEGEWIEIPETSLYRVRENDTWESIADRFLASAKRGFFLAKMNDFEKGSVLSEGTLIRIPYHVRHIFAPKETIRSVVRIYYEKGVTSRWLQAYNLTRKKRFERGDVLIVPLWKIRFTDEEQARIEEERSERYSDADAKIQEEIPQEIARVKAVYEAGHYVKTISIAQRLIGQGNLTVPQQIGIQNYLAFTYVALNEKALAIEAFGKAIELQPGMELSSITTSPKILDVFREAKDAIKPEPKAPSQAASPSPNGKESAPKPPDAD
ncbi:MAG: LysM peptidoglycan-binding domain-containing protein [Myxococcota bacterium]|nr:LysM peptidoglycan-binding domain-containing protein [Myxococcota bacterium]